ncbi:unnamed protein product, partial [Discosporangium mesarthrocarpum]
VDVTHQTLVHKLVDGESMEMVGDRESTPPSIVAPSVWRITGTFRIMNWSSSFLLVLLLWCWDGNIPTTLALDISGGTRRRDERNSIDPRAADDGQDGCGASSLPLVASLESGVLSGLPKRGCWGNSIVRAQGILCEHEQQSGRNFLPTPQAPGILANQTSPLTPELTNGVTAEIDTNSSRTQKPASRTKCSMPGGTVKTPLSSTLRTGYKHTVP